MATNTLHAVGCRPPHRACLDFAIARRVHGCDSARCRFIRQLRFSSRCLSEIGTPCALALTEGASVWAQRQLVVGGVLRLIRLHFLNLKSIPISLAKG